MKNKGFTLIELLAVIVILAIIALITTPIILNVIEKARLDSAKDKAYGVIEATKLAYTEAQTDDVPLPFTITYTALNSAPTIPGSTVTVKTSGEAPTSGTVTISDDGEITVIKLKFGNYYCSTIDSKTKYIDSNQMFCSKDSDAASPIIK